MSEQPTATPLWSALRVLRERWWIVVGVPVICVIVALGFALSGAKQYKATSKLLLQESNLAGALVGVSGVGQTDPTRLAATNLSLVTSNAVANRVKKQLNSPEPASSLLGQVSAAAEPDSDLVDVTAQAASPQEAAQLANAFAQQFVAFRRAADQQALQQGETVLRNRLSQLAPNQTADRTSLQDALSKVTALEVMQTGDAQVVDNADPPGSPSSPRPKLDAILGLVLGLALGVGLAFLIDMLDRRIKSTEDFEVLYGLRALATVPERHRAPRNERERNAQLEPFRILRNGLSFLSVGQQVQTVLVTSAVSGEGKSTVAAGLARAVALSGQSVILVEVDLRRPSLSSIFDLGDNPRGVTTALVGNVSPGELLRHPLAGLRSFSVLPSGPLPPNAAELLRSAEMSILLEDLRRRAEVIVLDAPPLLPVADAQVLLDNPQIDACLVVGRAFHTRREQARRARIVLERHRLRNIGLVVNALHQTDASYDYYDEGEDGRRPPVVVDTPPVLADEPARVLPLPRGQRR